MIEEIQGRTLLAHVKPAWFGIRYNMNIYRGCEHQCIYCDSRSECYQIEDFSKVQVKVNALTLLKDELPRKRVKGTIGTGSMSDPYTFAERDYRLVRGALAIIAQHRYPIHIVTKSDLILRDLDLLQEVNSVFAGVGFTLTTTDDELAAKIEPGAPSPSRRLAAIKTLSEAGIYVGVLMMPVLPFLEDNVDNVMNVVRQAAGAGAKYVVAGFGMSLRDRQRAYYYDRLDQFWPGLSGKYQDQFGERYSCGASNASRLEAMFHRECARHGMVSRMSDVRTYQSPSEQIEQLRLL